MINFSTRSFFILFMTVGVVACTNPAVDITNRAMDAHDSSAYNQYLKDVAQINLEREKAGLAPTSILSRAEWAGKK
jgi:hypothetical protein